ncbi:carbon-nitrogen hydrolase, partial [Mycena galericulata]
MPVPRLSPRIAIVQFQPKIGQVQANMAKARELCRGILPRSVDLVCLPEMVFSGYNFESAAAIDPYLEPSKIGPTSRFCAELATRLKCYVVAGYPERLEPSEVELYLTETGNHAVGANSAALYGPEGQWVGAYRKTNLFWTDKTWAKPGTGFATFSLPPPLRTVSLGICMDLNAMPPHSWAIETGPYELADYCLTEKTNVLVLLDFWAERLRPLWREPSESQASTSKDTGVVQISSIRRFLNHDRVAGTKFAGSSAAFHMKQGQGKSGILRAALG